jgi:F0F1-type ATP synthase membrane subunit b/b'
MAYWERLLKTEDECEQRIADAVAQSAQLIEARRQEANTEVERLRSDYKARLDQARAESEESIRQLQENLQAGQQAKKARAAEQVRSHKDQIVELLLSAVLNVPLD